MRRPAILHVLSTIASCMLLFMVGVSAAILWIYCRIFLPVALPGYGLSPAFSRIAAGVLTLLLLCAAPALPIYRLFPRHAVRAAAFIGWMPLFLSAMLAYEPEAVAASPFGMALALLEGAACWIAIVLGAWIAKRLLGARPG